MPKSALTALIVLVVLAGCSQATAPQTTPSPAPATAVLAAQATALSTATSIPSTATPIPPTPTESPAPAVISPAPPTPTPTPDLVAGLTIPDLRARAVGAGEITVGEVWSQTDSYTSYRISYPADGLTLTGLLHVPAGAGPFPLIIANRGTIARDIYQPGMDSRAFSDLMARNGYLVVAPDFRGYAGGDDGPNQFYTGYYMDVIGLIPLAQRLPMARPGKVGMWGHSRGGSATIAALTVSDQIAAAVVYAPAPADLAVDYARRFRQSNGNPGSGTWPFPPDADPDAYRRVSPISYFDAISAPVQLHHGTADSTVDESASVTIAETLRALGKEVTLHLYEGGGHALQGDAYNLYAERTLEFFRRHFGD